MNAPLAKRGGTLLGPDLTDPRGWSLLALQNPQLAVSLLGGIGRMNALKKAVGVGVCNEGIIRPDLLGYGNIECGSGGWEIINIKGQFTSGACGTVVQGQIVNAPVTSDMWIREVVYSVERPNAFAGSIFKAQSDYYNSLQPGITFQLTIKSLCQYVIAPDYTPLQNINQVFSCVCPAGFVLGCSTNILAEFVNTRDFANDEIPTDVTITLHAMRLPTLWGQCGFDDAVSALKEFGLITNC